MNSFRILVGILLSVILTCHIAAVADSLLSESEGLGNIYETRTARKVGDVLKVIFNEKTVSSQSAKGKLKSQYVTGADQGQGLLEKFLGLGLSGGHTQEIDANTVQKNSVTALMSARVIEVLPGGNLIIEGTKTVEVNHETQKLTITGAVRAKDITPGNTIDSSRIANMKARVNGLPVNRSVKKQRGGIIRWLLNIVF
ncbi:MAG: flagellar basal body L-ring protein FlgH [Candidatus Eremiobacteraeota bacterium]|nr:flagellar basal body L-ring protein FlgH [Candidatus Eremiobacteraeota bacterium]